MIFFIPYNHVPSRCPKCREIENKVEICAHCRYEYPQGDDKFTAWLIIGLILSFFVAAIFFADNMFGGGVVGMMDRVMAGMAGIAFYLGAMMLLAGILYVGETLLGKK